MDNERVDNSTSRHLPMFIVDVLQHDVAERLDSILRLLNNDSCIGWREFWPRDFNEPEVILALGELVKSGLVTVYREDTNGAELVATELRELPDDVADYWYGRSAAGIAAWDSWEPPVSESEK